MLEVCAYNIQSCRIAEQAGAKRIELCADPAAGGVTPGYGTIQYVLEQISIPAYIMLRPRGGNFVYDADELAIMCRDIQILKELGCPGIATGVLLPDGRIDTEQMKRITELAYPMGVTCHKAFDRTPDAAQALEDVIASGCERILTSGLMPTAMDGAHTLHSLVTQAAGRIIIMPGGGVRSTNLAQLRQITGATEFHSSGITSTNTDYLYIASAAEIKAMVREVH